MTDNRYDVIIIGSGAGGGTLAYHLAPSGKRILLLERGDYVRREKDNWSSRAVNVVGKYNTREQWHDKDGKPLHPHPNYYAPAHTNFYRPPPPPGYSQGGENTSFTGARLSPPKKGDSGKPTAAGAPPRGRPPPPEESEPSPGRADPPYGAPGERGGPPPAPWAGAPYRSPA